MSFNAGAIEASLTLGRSQWLKDLRTTRKEIADLERRSITIEIDADSTNAQIVMDNIEMLAKDLDDSSYSFSIDANTAEASAKLDLLEEQADRLDTKVIGIEADADITNATIQLDILENHMDVLESDPINIRADVDAAKANATLDALEEQADRLDTKVIGIEADADTTNAMVALDNLENQMDLLESDPVNIRIDLDAEDTQVEMVEIASLANALDQTDIGIGVELDGYATANAQMLTLAGQAALMDGTSIDIDVDVDQDALESLVGAGGSAGGGGGGGSLGLLRILLYAIILLSPVLAVSISSLTASIVAFVGAMSAAAGAALILGGGLFGLVKMFKDTDPSDYTPAMQAFADAIDAVKDAWDGVLDKIQGPGFSLMAQGLEIVADILPDMVPLFNNVADAMSGVLDGLASWIDSPQYQEMLDFFGGFGVDMLVQFLEIGGNLLQFFGELFAAIEPFAREMMTGLEDLTQSWADWAAELDSNRAFQDFMENASTYGPMVLDMLGSLLDAFMTLGDALLPFAGPMLEGLTWFFDLIANADPTVLTTLIGIFAGLWAGASIVAPLLGAIATGLEAITIATGIGLGPLALLIAAVGLVAYAFWDLWQKGGEMRDQITEVWTTMKETIEPIVTQIKDAIMNNIGPLKDWWAGIWGSIQGIVESAFIIISQIIELALNIIQVWWAAWGDDLIKIVSGALQMIGGLIKAGFAIIETAFKLIKAAVTGDWGAMWGILKDGASKFWSGMTDIWNGWIKITSGVWSSITEAPVQAWQAIFGDGGKLRTQWDTFKTWIEGKWDNLITWFGGLGARFATATVNTWDGLRTSFKNVMNDIIGWWNNFSLYLDIPDKIPGLPDSFTISTPNIDYLADGAYLNNGPRLAVVGEAGNEIVAPEPILREIVQEHSGGGFDAKALAAAIGAAIAPVMARLGLSVDELTRVIVESGVGVNIDARSYGDGSSAANELANNIAFQLRLLGFGGQVAA